MIIERSKRTSLLDIALQANLCGAMQWHQTAFAKLGAPDDQSVRSNVFESELDCLRHAKSRARQQSEKRGVGLSTKGIPPTHAGCCFDEPFDVVDREDVRHGPWAFLAPEYRGRDLMTLVFCAKVSRKPDYLTKSARSRGNRPRYASPLNSSFSADVALARAVGVLREALKEATFGVKREAHGAPDPQIRFHSLSQHEVTSGQGCDISRSATTSTFA